MKWTIRATGCFAIVIAAVLISGCNENRANDRLATEVSSPLPSEPALQGEQESDIELYWKEFAPLIAQKQNLYGHFEEKPYEYYVAGLRNEDPLIRWYCLYRLTDYPDLLTEERLVEIKAMQDDSDSDVARAASFAYGVLGGGYEGEAFVRTSDSKAIAYFKYQEAYYNNGEIYLVRDGRTVMIWQEPSTTRLTISPNDRFLYIGYGGRIWETARVMDVQGEHWIDLPDMIRGLVDVQGSEYAGKIDKEKIEGDYQWIHFQEWSPDGNKFLYYYQFMEGHSVFEGYAVMDVATKAITRVLPNQDGYSSGLPNDFKW